MDSNSFRSARSYLNYSPLSKWAAMFSSAAAAVCLPLMLPVLYLFADLVVWQGYSPGYSGLAPSMQKSFRDEWESKLSQQTEITDTLNKIRPASASSSAFEWDARWLATNYTFLDQNVSHDAAETYLPLDGANGKTGPSRLGVLSTIVRERSNWTANLLAVFAKFNPWAWRPSIDNGTGAAYLTGLFAIAFLLGLVRVVFLNLSTYLTTKTVNEAVTRLRRTIFNHSQRLAAVAIKPEAQREAGELITNRVEHVMDGFFAWMSNTFRGPIKLLLLFGILFSVNIWVTLSLLLVGGLVWLLAGQAAAWYRQDARRAARRAESRLGLLKESLSVMQLIKAYLMERFSQTRVERHLTELSRAAWRRQRGETYSRPTLFAVVSLASILLLYLCGWLILNGQMTVAGLLVKASALAILVMTLYSMLYARLRMARARVAAADIFEFLDRRAEAGQAIDVEFLQPLAKRLDFAEVSLREPGTGRMVLENVSLAIPAGSKVAVVYNDPAEAHALAYLIVRFLDPTAGEVRFDGKNIRWVTYESLRTQAAVVLEQSLTFTDTVANNIGCGDPSYSLPQIIEAAKLAHAHQFVQHLPNGYETPIGEGGASLKLGERFRIALARAILRDPSLIVVEEPSEHVDPDSLALIDDALTRVQPGRTILFLARRPSTVRSADRVFVLQNGKLAASGRHEELLAGSEIYRLMHFKQSLTASSAV